MKKILKNNFHVNNININKPSNRHEIIYSGIGLTFLFIIMIIFRFLISKEEKSDFIQFPFILMWTLLLLAIIGLFIHGLCINDFILNEKGIQLPHSKLRSIFYHPKVREYNEIIHIKLIKNPKSEFTDDFCFEIQFKDGYIGLLSYWDLLNANLSKSQINDIFNFFIKFLKDYNK